MTEFVRATCPKVEPLEVWDLEFDGQPVWKAIGSQAIERHREAGQDPSVVGRSTADAALDFSRRLRRGVYGRECFRSGQQRTAAAVEGCATVCLTGGLTRLSGFESALDEAGADVLLLTEDRDVLAGARRALAARDRGGEVALVADVGQTAIKTGLMSADGVVGEVRRFARPWDRLPVWESSEGYRGRSLKQHEAIDRVVRFIADAVSRTLGAAAAPVSTLVLALPCELGPDLGPAECSYGDWTSAPGLVHRVVEATRLASTADLVVGLNDAELAGYAVLDRLEAAGRAGDALVLTLGFGPGGAYVDAAASDGATDG